MNVWMQHERFLSLTRDTCFYTTQKSFAFTFEPSKCVECKGGDFQRFSSSSPSQTRTCPESHLRISFDTTARHKHNNIIRLQTFRLVYVELASSSLFIVIIGAFSSSQPPCDCLSKNLSEILLLFSRAMCLSWVMQIRESTLNMSIDSTQLKSSRICY